MSRTALAAACALIVLAQGAPACGRLHGESAWVRVLPGDGPWAAYLTLRNDGGFEQTITGVSSPDFESASLHETVYVQGRARMRRLERIALGAGALFEAKPGGPHVMLSGARRKLAPPDVVTLEFQCAGGGSVEVPAVLRGGGP